MFLATLLAASIGIMIGTVTGLTPGVHINLASILIVAAASKIANINPEYAVATIISMAITHTFLDTIPSVYLGVPDPEKVAVVLPTHKMVFEGKAYEAVMLTIFGSFISLIVCMILIPAFIVSFKYLQELIKPYLGWLLLALTAMLILHEKKKVPATTIFLLSGTLGILTLNLPNLNEPLLPLLSGLFGLSTLILGVKDDSKLPKQELNNMDLDARIKYKSIACAVLAGAAGSFLPGIGPSQVAILGSSAFRNLGNKGYIIIVGGLNTVNMALSIAMLYSVNKARNGAIVAISQLINGLNLKLFLTLCSICLFAAGISTMLTIILSRKITKLIPKVNYKAISLSIIIFIILLIAIMSGWKGLLIAAISTSLGIYCNYLDIGKNHMMGCLLLPVMLYFL